MCYFILHFLQACDGSVSQLRQYLVEMKRNDAVNIIDKALEKKEGGDSSSAMAIEGEGTSVPQTQLGKGAPGEYMEYLCEDAMRYL